MTEPDNDAEGISQTDMKEWYAGMPCTGQRMLRAAELAALRLQARRYLLQCAAILLSAVLASVIFWIAAQEADRRSTMEQNGLASAAIVLIVVGVPLSFVLVRDFLARCGALRSDLGHGYVKLFSGTATVDGDDTLMRLRRATGFGPPDMDARLQVEVLPVSGRVWHYNGRYVRSWITAYSADVAEAPPIAAIAAGWLQVVSESRKGKVLANRRDLSPAERQELRCHIERTWLRPLPLAVGLTVWLMIPVGVLFVNGHLANPDSWLAFWRLFFLAFAADAYFAWRAVQAMSLRRDLENGAVLIVRFESHDQEDPSSSSNSATPAASKGVMEVLPVSRRVWTDSGEAASWRKGRS